MYSCFKEPKTDRLYKIRATGIEESYTNGTTQANDNIDEEALAKVARLVNTNATLLDVDTVSQVTTEVLLVHFSSSLFPSSLGTLATVDDVPDVSNRDKQRMLTVEQTDSLVEKESFAVEIDTIRREIVSFSSKPLVLVYTYGEDPLKKHMALLDRINCPYAVTPEITSINDLVIYLKTILFIWKNPRNK